MAKKKAVAVAVPDVKKPVLEANPLHVIPVVIRGETYELCFDVPKLAEAEKHFRSQGHRLNLMFSLPEMTLSGIRDSFPCLVHHSRPELSFEAAQALVDMQSAYPIATAIVQALNGTSRQREQAEHNQTLD